MDVPDWLSDWYEAQCDGEWEHGYGPSITTLDNPGWSLEIDLAGTDCDGRTLARIEHNMEHDIDWWTCWTEDNKFCGAGGPRHLRSLLETFRNWVEKRLKAERKWVQGLSPCLPEASLPCQPVRSG